MHLLPQSVHDDADVQAIESFKEIYQEIHSAKSILLVPGKLLHKFEHLPKLKKVSVIKRTTNEIFHEVTTIIASLALDLIDEVSELTDESKLIFNKLTIKAGKHFSTAASVKEVPRFIKTYNIDMSEFEEAQQYNSFNDFFSRKIKLNLRPMPSDPYAFLSAADCRCMVFSDSKKATDIWIKGNEFSIAKLVLDDQLANRYIDNCCLVIFRLAPDDYHRWHFPFNGVLKSINIIPGTYYTVNPKAVNSCINVFTENHRVVRVFDTDFGEIVEIAVGALLVGSISVNHTELNAVVQQGEDAGYFAYGGSTVIYLINKNRVIFDDDLLQNGHQRQMETYIKVREQIGYMAK